MFIAFFHAIAGTSAGVGFAIPSSTVLRIVPQLIQFGKVSASWKWNHIHRNNLANSLALLSNFLCAMHFLLSYFRYLLKCLDILSGFMVDT